jgi:hypothetical protein
MVNRDSLIDGALQLARTNGVGAIIALLLVYWVLMVLSPKLDTISTQLSLVYEQQGFIVDQLVGVKK